MGKTALIVIDTQVNMFDEDVSVYESDRILKVIGTLTQKARAAGREVIYIRNNGPAGEPDQPGTRGWHIHPAIAPGEHDLIIDKKGSDAFLGTDLKAELDHRGVDHLVFVGMQTEMCIATTVEKASILGYSVTLASDGHTTFDWDEISAADAISKYNKDLAQFANIQKSADIAFV